MAIWTFLHRARDHYHLGWLDLSEYEFDIRLAFDQFEKSTQILADIIPSHVYGEMQRYLGRLRKIWDTMLDLMSRGESSVGPSATRTAPWQEDWQGLRRFADKALPRDHPLRLIYELGFAVGEYDREFGQGDGPSSIDVPGETDKLPDPSDLVLAAAGLPESVLDRSPLLRSLSLVARDADPVRMLEFYKS